MDGHISNWTSQRNETGRPKGMKLDGLKGWKWTVKKAWSRRFTVSIIGPPTFELSRRSLWYTITVRIELLDRFFLIEWPSTHLNDYPRPSFLYRIKLSKFQLKWNKCTVTYLKRVTFEPQDDSICKLPKQSQITSNDCQFENTIIL